MTQPRIPSKQIKHRAGYKHQLYGEENVFVQLVYIRPTERIVTPYCTIETDGWMEIKSWYAWDGASGPTWDTPTCDRGSLVHDCVADCIRDGYLPFETWKLNDKELFNILKEDGMNSFRIGIWKSGLAIAAGGYAKKSSKRKILISP